MWRERGFQVYHAALFHHGTDGSDAGHFADVLRCLVEGSALIALSHQDVLILVFGTLQFGTAFYNPVLRGCPVEKRIIADLLFLDYFLSQRQYVEVV